MKATCFRKVILISSSRDFCINTETILAERQFFIYITDMMLCNSRITSCVSLLLFFFCVLSLFANCYRWEAMLGINYFFQDNQWHIHVLIVQPEGEIYYNLCVFWFILSTSQVSTAINPPYLYQFKLIFISKTSTKGNSFDENLKSFWVSDPLEDMLVRPLFCFKILIYIFFENGKDFAEEFYRVDHQRAALPLK